MFKLKKIGVKSVGRFGCGIALICGILSGCSTASVFTPYPEQMQKVQQETQAQDYQGAEALLMPQMQSNDWQLYALELGRVQQLAGEYKQSITTFTLVINAVEKQLMAPKVQGAALLATSGSLLTNDNALPYQLKGYEIILLYQYQAMNYLITNNLQAALVCFRRADELQAYLDTLHQKQLAEATAAAEQKQITTPDMSQEAVLQSTFQAASTIKSSYQNALNYFLASFTFAASGNLNDAVVAMQKALETAPDNVFVQTELLQLLEERGGGQDQIDTYLKLFQMKQVPTMPANTGQIVVVLEEGFIPAMQQVSIPLPLPGLNSVQNFVFPAYTNTVSTPNAWQVSLDGKSAQDLAPIMSLEPLAAKALAEEYPIIFMRQALRVMLQAGVVQASENAAQNSANNSSNANNSADSNNAALSANLIGLIATAYSSFMTKADLRSWLLLPADVAVGVYTVPAGAHQFVFNARQNQPVSVKINAGQTALIWVNAQGNALINEVSAF